MTAENEAPERIWADLHCMSGDGEASATPIAGEYVTEYARADLLTALREESERLRGLVIYKSLQATTQEHDADEVDSLLDLETLRFERDAEIHTARAVLNPKA